MKCQWYWGGQPIGGATNLSLTLWNVSTPDAGAYQVTVTNTAGLAISDPATLTVGNIDPQDSSTNLKLNSALATSGGSGITLNFQALADKSYTIQARDSLTTGNWSKLVDFPAQPTTRIAPFADHPSGGTRFYRLVSPMQ